MSCTLSGVSILLRVLVTPLSASSCIVTARVADQIYHAHRIVSLAGGMKWCNMLCSKEREGARAQCTTPPSALDAKALEIPRNSYRYRMNQRHMLCCCLNVNLTTHRKMLLCDGCDDGWHLYCLPIPLAEVPEEDWFCMECGFDVGDSDLTEVDEDDS